jgi:argininosuccinate lyase
MRASIDPAMLATDLADYLAAKGIPFRQAHGLVGMAVRLADQRRVNLDQLSLEEFRSIHPDFGDDVFAVFNPENSIARRAVRGGTAREAVVEQIKLAKAKLAKA